MSTNTHKPEFSYTPVRRDRFDGGTIDTQVMYGRLGWIEYELADALGMDDGASVSIAALAWWEDYMVHPDDGRVLTLSGVRKALAQRESRPAAQLLEAIELIANGVLGSEPAPDGWEECKPCDACGQMPA